MKRRRRLPRRRLTDEGLVVVMSVLMVPSCVLICTDSCLLIAIAMLWMAVAVVLARLWSPRWANRAGKRLGKWLGE